MTVPSNLIPTLITSLPVAPVPTPTATMVCVIGGVTYQVPFIDLQSTVSVPATRMINTGGGLQGGGNLSADRTLSIATAGVTTDKIATTGVVAGTYGSGTEIPVVTVNAQGQVTSVTTASLVVSGYVPDTRQIIAGTGLSGGGNLQANRTLSVNFSNATPLAVGSATSGTAVEAARGDHVHPAVDLADATEVTGILPLTQGGTGQQVLNNVQGAIWYNDGTGFAQTVAGVLGQVLVSNGSSAPSWGSALIVSDQPANYVYAGPTSGAAAPTTFRLLVNADIPSVLTGKTLSVDNNTISGLAASSFVLSNGSGNIDGAAAQKAIPTGVVVGDSDSQTLTNKTISGSANTLSNIGNSSLVNSSITVGTTTINLGGSSLTLGGLTSVAVTQDPTTALQLATKQYVDSVAQGLNVKTSVLYGTTANILLTGLSVQAGGEWTGALTVGDRILVKNQTLPAENGIYAASALGWTRTSDADTWNELISAFVFVQDGATLADTGWVCTINPGGTLGVTAVTWSQFSGAGTYTAGTGLALSGTQFSITNTGVSANTYGSASAVPVFAVNAQGQLTSVTNTTIAITNSQVSGSAASGANSDITSLSGLTGGISTPDFIQFDTTATVTDATGKLYYNKDDQFQTLSFQMNGSRVQHVGEELYYRVRLSAPATKGDVLMFTGTLGSSGGLTAAPATGLTADQANYILGIADQTGTTNDWITVVEFGEVRGINTTGGSEAWTQGQVLYYNPAVAGGLTDTKPTTPNAIAVMAAVVHVGTSNGILFVRPTFGSVLGGTDGNVQFGTLANGDVIVYNGTNSRWENSPSISGGTYA